MKVKIYYTYTSNEGEQFDDEENFVGNNTKTILKSKTVDYKDVGIMLNEIGDVAADYGDGITNARVVIIVDAETNEVLPRRYDYWM